MPDLRTKSAEEVFGTIVERPHAEWDHLLREECGCDDRLRAEVSSLLYYDQHPYLERLDTAIQEVASGLAGEDSWVGRRLGSYKLTKELGVGGMGAVYLAERADDRFERKVAIKLLHRAMDTWGLRERLVDERRILAALDHPNIAKLLDGAETEEGIPYLVMEYVDGQPLHHYAANHPLRPREACALMVKLCGAVSYAHHNLVIHRDLKPANILITADGTPKLLDFGIAHLRDVDENLAKRAFTPGYASPELAEGRPVTTSADVFSLGVILRELLQTPTPPADPDLAAILVKATAPDPHNRYSSATELSRDLSSYLTGFPVSARPNNFPYRAGKFLKRHRWTAAGLTLAAAGLIVTAGVALWEASRAKQALAVAEAQRHFAEQRTWEAQQATQVADHEHTLAAYERDRAVASAATAERRLEQLVSLAGSTVTDIHDTLEKIPGATEDRRKIVQQTLRFLDKTRADNGDDAQVLQTVANGYLKMASVLGAPNRPNLGDPGGALRNLATAEEVVNQLLRQNPRDVMAQATWIRIQEVHADILFYQANNEAVPLLTRALHKAQAWQKANPLVDELAIRQAGIQRLLSHLLANDNSAESARQVQQSIALLEPLARRHPDSDDILDQLAAAYGTLQESRLHPEDFKEAFQSSLLATQIREHLAALHPDNVTILRNLMISYSKLGDFAGGLDFSMGDRVAAMSYYRKMVDLAERLSRSDPANQNARFDYAMALQRAGRLQPAAGQEAESLDMLRRAVDQFEALVKDHKIPRYQLNLAEAHEHYGQRLAESGDAGQGFLHAERSLQIAQDLITQSPRDTTFQSQLLYSYLRLIPLAADRLPPEKATAIAQEATARARSFEALLNRPHLARILAASAGVYQLLGDPARACAAYSESAIRWSSMTDYSKVDLFHKEWDAAREQATRCALIATKVAK
jgi:eukaryotic-like serine/threonine-protein kinase